MGQALYRKYRSRSFDEVVGQDHIVKTLKNAIKNGKISHAYLFTGPRGVGKTSVARILAHEVNGLSYNDESIHLDIIEIDAASNRRIDEIRDLRERVRIAPTTAEYKVYIIDEVHMLTREAFNALLKTLEEPPAHVIFILATTEAHKLPETIISRTQRFEFKPVSQAQAAAHLANLAKKEKISVEPAALDLLAEFGGGSFRDSIGYLDQLSSLDKKITEDDVRNMLGLPTAQSVDSLLELIRSSNGPDLLKQLIQIEQAGVSPAALASELSNRLRGEVLNGNVNHEQIALLKNLGQVSASSRPQETLEIVLLETIGDSQPVAQAVEQKPQASSLSKPVAEPVKKKAAAKDKTTGEFELDDWDHVLDVTKSQAASIYTALRLAEPDYSDGTLTLRFKFPLHQKKLAQIDNRELVAEIIKQVSGADITVQSVLIEGKSVEPVTLLPDDSPVNAINNIFGSTEVLEA